mmetsp:Transcript_38409/g.108543  ORF Transcript_38409/g.108543 Transcript_38409/m.108543 type:complete len:478 (-) Transcript_38409:13-1446(-)
MERGPLGQGASWVAPSQALNSSGSNGSHGSSQSQQPSPEDKKLSGSNSSRNASLLALGSAWSPATTSPSPTGGEDQQRDQEAPRGFCSLPAPPPPPLGTNGGAQPLAGPQAEDEAVSPDADHPSRNNGSAPGSHPSLTQQPLVPTPPSPPDSPPEDTLPMGAVCAVPPVHGGQEESTGPCSLCLSIQASPLPQEEGGEEEDERGSPEATTAAAWQQAEECDVLPDKVLAASAPFTGLASAEAQAVPNPAAVVGWPEQVVTDSTSRVGRKSTAPEGQQPCLWPRRPGFAPSAGALTTPEAGGTNVIGQRRYTVEGMAQLVAGPSSSSGGGSPSHPASTAWRISSQVVFTAPQADGAARQQHIRRPHAEGGHDKPPSAGIVTPFKAEAGGLAPQRVSSQHVSKAGSTAEGRLRHDPQQFLHLASGGAAAGARGAALGSANTQTKLSISAGTGALSGRGPRKYSDAETERIARIMSSRRQ